MIPHLVTGALPGGLAVQVEGASSGLIGFNPAVFSPAFFPEFHLPSLPLSLSGPWDSLGKLVFHLFMCHHRLFLHKLEIMCLPLCTHTQMDGQMS